MKSLLNKKGKGAIFFHPIQIEAFRKNVEAFKQKEISKIQYYLFLRLRVPNTLDLAQTKYMNYRNMRTKIVHRV